MTVSLEKQMKSGELYVEYGHPDQADQVYEKVIEHQREQGKELQFDYNNTRPSDQKKKKEILTKLLAEMGEEIWIEAPMHMSYGPNVHIGNHFYANYNLTIVDDVDVYIGDYVMCAPNVSIVTTGHPVYGPYRRNGAQFSDPIHIGNDVWIGANVVILPGVSVGNDVVIGAGSVVTKDIPDHSVAMGVPCKVVRTITDYDKEYYRKNCKVNLDFDPKLSEGEVD